MNNRIYLILALAFFAVSQSGYAQRLLSLQDAVFIAKSQSVAAKRAETRRDFGYWNYRVYASSLGPQLNLEGTLPRFTRAYRGITQQDGSVEYRFQNQNLMDLELNIDQVIPLTGTQIFMGTSLSRSDDFNRDFIGYAGDPFSIGFIQPLFSFNRFKWDKKIEPLNLEESKREFVEELEQISSITSAFFFDLLTAQISLQIAEQNVASNDTIYKIAQGRYELGKIPENELLQLELSLMNSRQAVARAEVELETAQLILRSYLGLDPSENLELVTPNVIPAFSVDEKKALEMAWVNRSDAVSFKRRMLEAEMMVENTVKEGGLNVDIFGRLGFSNNGAVVTDIYTRPENQLVANVGFNIPLVDWGRQRALKKMADLNHQLTAYEVQTDTANFTQEIYTQVKSFDMLRGQVEIAAKADEISQKRYEISKNRYLIGKISITDLSLALTEKDRAKQDYLSALGAFWEAYYRLRSLTLYDFSSNELLYTPEN